VCVCVCVLEGSEDAPPCHGLVIAALQATHSHTYTHLQVGRSQLILQLRSMHLTPSKAGVRPGLALGLNLF